MEITEKCVQCGAALTKDRKRGYCSRGCYDDFRVLRFWERFWGRVDKDGPTPKDASLGKCWIWMGSKNRGGYGTAKRGGIVTFCHRQVLELSVGPLAKGLFALHKCDNPSCVRPEHLFAGTIGDNTRDMIAKGRRYVGKGNAKLSPSQISMVKQIWNTEDCSQREIGERFGVSQSTISSILLGDTWKSLG